MRYVAKTYIGRDFCPGEIIEAEEFSNEDQIKWLLEAGAIEEIAPEGQGTEIKEEAAEPVIGMNPPEEIPEDLAVDDEAPEIDAMAGIVKEEKKPSRRRKGGKKES
jgi:hypothetical protein